ncbi:MAG TPA: hypothetical protein VK911_02405 [Vicinamibacterales bacterium]|nr:hypothetical protein [Vicinamibacterales bacterium]
MTTRKNVVSDTLDDVADSVRRVGAPLRERSARLADYAENAAGRLQQYATDLRQRDVAEFGEDLKVLARKYPGAFLATGVAAGVLAGRFLKSTAEEERPQNRPGARRAGAAAEGGYRARTTRPGAAAPRSTEGERHG